MLQTRERLEDIGKLLLRLVVAAPMLFHGIDKVLNGPGHVRVNLAEQGMPDILAYGVYVGEVVAPAFVLAGVWARFWALVYSLSITFATLLVHGADFVHLAPTEGWAAELWVFYMSTPLVIALLGPGRYVLRTGSGPWT